MANEKDFRELDDKIHDYELDEAFDLAFDIDAFLRERSFEYRRNFPDEQKQREEIADNMLQSQTFFVKHLISSILGREGGALMKRLKAYETEFRKNQYAVYRLKSGYDKEFRHGLQSMREKGNYINTDMYDIVYSEPLDKNEKPMGIEMGLIMYKSCGVNVYVPDLRDIITINYDGEEKAYFRQLKDYVEVPEFVGVHIASAALSNYKGLTAFVGKDGNVYLGKSERYLNNEKNGFKPFYDNSDNSLTFISANTAIYSFLYSSGWVLSQQEMITIAAFKESDYSEFAELQKGILSKFEPIREITFKGEPFNYPDYDRNIEQTTEKQITEKGELKNMSDYIFKAFIVNRSEYDNGNKETSGAWLYFPTDAETVKRTFEEIGLYENASSDTYFFDDYVCGNEDLRKCFSQYESVDALNYLARRITELEDVEMTVFQTALEAGECKNVIGVINLTYNTEYYEVVPDIFDYDDLGKYYVDENNMVLGDAYDYFDFEKFGMEKESEGGGVLLNGVYLKMDCAEYKKVYEGNTLYIPSEYRVTSIEYEQGYSAEKFNQAKHLAETLHRFFLAHDKDYAAKYSSPDNSREIYLVDCLLNGKLDYIKNMLDDLGQTENDVLPAELAEYEKVFFPESGNHLENAEKSEEQNYDRIDGIINNTDKKPSIKEQLKTISDERPKSEPKPQKRPPEETR